MRPSGPRSRSFITTAKGWRYRSSISAWSIVNPAGEYTQVTPGGRTTSVFGVLEGGSPASSWYIVGTNSPGRYPGERKSFVPPMCERSMRSVTGVGYGFWSRHASLAGCNGSD